MGAIERGVNQRQDHDYQFGNHGHWSDASPHKHFSLMPEAQVMAGDLCLPR
jgi:hypothetical protein